MCILLAFNRWSMCEYWLIEEPVPTNTSQGDCWRILFWHLCKTLTFWHIPQNPFISFFPCHMSCIPSIKSWKQYETSEIHYVRKPCVMLETSGTFNIFSSFLIYMLWYKNSINIHFSWKYINDINIPTIYTNIFFHKSYLIA